MVLTRFFASTFAGVNCIFIFGAGKNGDLSDKFWSCVVVSTRMTNWVFLENFITIELLIISLFGHF